MNFTKSLLILLVVLTTSTAMAQKENTEKILGCWVFKKLNILQKLMLPMMMSHRPIV